MQEKYMLETVDLGISFGGLKAVQEINLKIHKNQLYGRFRDKLEIILE